MEKRESVDQKRERVRQFLTENAATLRENGTVVESWRSHGGRRLGPYYRLAFRMEGQQCSLYLGADPQLADEVREQLAVLRAPAGGQLQQQRRILRRELSRQRRLWNAELRKHGLYLKGNEVRGWRIRPAIGRSPNDLNDRSA